MPRPKVRCPHCGNDDPATIEDNGLDNGDTEYTLLCTRRVTPEESSYDRLTLASLGHIDADDRTFCGMQWRPNDRDEDDARRF